MSAPTPGPWEVTDDLGSPTPGGKIIMAGDVVVAVLSVDVGDPEEVATLAADAALIAAAPDLLSEMDPRTLELLAKQVEAGHRPEQVAENLRTIADRQRATAAKARGGK